MLEAIEALVIAISSIVYYRRYVSKIESRHRIRCWYIILVVLCQAVIVYRGIPIAVIIGNVGLILSSVEDIKDRTIPLVLLLATLAVQVVAVWQYKELIVIEQVASITLALIILMVLLKKTGAGDAIAMFIIALQQAQLYMRISFELSIVYIMAGIMLIVGAIVFGYRKDGEAFVHLLTTSSMIIMLVIR